ncbi:MAG: integrase [gamma proteobacterium symbiont of Stewartia floridana]|nr:MAG: integrase [gamma proteobacterium symbiont of Stewartia floridana]
MSSRLNFTLAALDKLKLPVVGKRAYYNDSKVLGLQVQVTANGTKTFYVYRRINGRPKRVKLGRYPDMKPAQAREQAKITLGQIAEGKDPIEIRRREHAESVTLDEAFGEFLSVRKLKDKTAYDYRRVVEVAFSDWKRKQILKISKELVAKRHARLGRERGEAYANLSMRVLRSILNFASSRYEDEQGRSLLPENPVKRLSDTRAWYRQKRRNTYISQPDLAPWLCSVLDLKSHPESPMAVTVADYLLLMLFTGIRREEAAQLKWADVDLNAKTFITRDTKNHEDHTLPLSDFLHEMLKVRSSEVDGDYVFPGQKGNPYIIEPRRYVKLIAEVSGVPFIIHDLRRTFTTVAESLDIPAYALKRLLNHKMSNDVTAGYIVADVERLRKPMQMVADFLLSVGKVNKQAEVLVFERRHVK